MAISGEAMVRRTKRRLEVRFGVTAPDTTGFTRNVSESGLYIETNRALPPDTPLQLQIRTPEGPFEMRGEVIWSRRYPARFAQVKRGGMGCRFVHPSREWIDFYRRWKSEI